MPNYSDPNLRNYDPMNIWNNYDDGYSTVEALKTCLILGLKIGGYYGLNFEKKKIFYLSLLNILITN